MVRARLVRRKGVTYWTLPTWEALGYRSAFFQRTGGVSRAPYAGLNLGLTTEDLPEYVLENRLRAVEAAKFGPLAPAVGQQVHGAHIQVVTARGSGRGWFDPGTAFQETDALISTVPGLPLGVAVADCLPVLLVAEGRVKGAAAIHAGWKGIAQSIISRTVDALGARWKISSQRIHAAVGPGIGPERFCIRGEVLKCLQGQYPEAVVPEERYQPVAGFDLWSAARLQLLHAGVPLEKITLIRECTATYPTRYFSYRRDGKLTGRMLGMIQILE